MAKFEYHSGEQVEVGDKVSIGAKQATVELVIAQRTKESREYDCQSTGGILLKFEDGDLQLWPFVNEDLVFLGRD